METLFTLNPSANSLQLQDAIRERFIKAKALVTCLMFAVEFLREDMALDRNSVFHTLFAIDDFLEEIDILYSRLSKLQPA